MKDNPFKPFDVTAGFWYYRTSGGARKYILISKVTPKGVIAYRITSHYQDKSEYIRQQYYEIKDWKKAGMIKQSWIDIKGARRFSLKNISLEKRGELSLDDQVGLIRFIKDYPSRIKKFKEQNKDEKRNS